MKITYNTLFHIDVIIIPGFQNFMINQKIDVSTENTI